MSPNRKLGGQPVPPEYHDESVEDSSPRMTAVTRKRLQKPPLSPSKILTSTNSVSHQGSLCANNFDFGGVIGPRNLHELAACPCCNQCREDLNNQQQVVDGTPTKAIPAEPLVNRELDSESNDSDDEEALPKGQAEGVNYYPKKIVVEGWLHKKGSGKDFLGSRYWKPRWARLVMARVDGYEVDVPLLMIYWYSATPTPSNVIVLDSTVVFPIDLEDKTSWDAYRFDIRNARTVTTNSTVNRTFTAPKKARDVWIYAISQALLMYEKANDKARKAAANQTRTMSPVPSLGQQKSSPYEVWSRDGFVSPPKKDPCPRTASPPKNPAPWNPKTRSAAQPEGSSE